MINDDQEILYFGQDWYERLAGTRWQERPGHVVEADQLDPRHRANARRWLRERVARIRRAVELYERIAVYPDDPMWRPSFEQDLEWLYRQPLFKALVAAELDQRSL